MNTFSKSLVLLWVKLFLQFWPILFQRFIDDGFGVFEGTKDEVEYWIRQVAFWYTHVEMIWIMQKSLFLKSLYPNLRAIWVHNSELISSNSRC